MRGFPLRKMSAVVCFLILLRPWISHLSASFHYVIFFWIWIGLAFASFLTSERWVLYFITLRIKPFPSSLLSLFQSEAKCGIVLMWMETDTRLEIEAQVNSKEPSYQFWYMAIVRTKVYLSALLSIKYTTSRLISSFGLIVVQFQHIHSCFR